MGGRSDKRYFKPRLLALLLASILSIAALTALGVWQLERRVWKLALIEQVDQRIHAFSSAAPGPQEWASLTASRDAYRHLAVHGMFLNDLETTVHATTIYGRGFWVLTPLKTDEGFIVLINRGFVPSDKRAADTRIPIQGETFIDGLLRMSEPKGGFLHTNNPAEGQWYSRDVTAIAAASGLANVAPYFIDADAKANPGELPIGGLTVVSFPNNHLVYALTWFSLALILGGMTVKTFILKD